MRNLKATSKVNLTRQMRGHKISSGRWLSLTPNEKDLSRRPKKLLKSSNAHRKIRRRQRARHKKPSPN